MASDTKNVKLGVCKVFFNKVDLGYTQGGVEVTVKTDTHKVNVDQFGKTTINEYIMGREVTVKVPLAETTLDNMVAIMPGATLHPGAGSLPAAGSLTIATNPTDGQTINVNGKVVTFAAAPAGALQVGIGANAAATATALAAKLSASTDPALNVATYSASGAAVNVQFATSGTVGNAFTLATGTAGANVTVSGATLSGGVNGTAPFVEVTNGVGTDLLGIAKELRLHPKSLPDTDVSEDFAIPLAATAGGLKFAYKLENERIFDCDFTGYPDPISGKLFTVGE
jgi:hypothetical protein